MRVFYAATGSKYINDLLYEKKVENILLSYYTIRNKKGWLEYTAKQFPFIFLDSGGFVARTKGIEISIEEYGNFIAQNKAHVYVYANLDVKDTSQTLYNQHYLESRGLSPIPVFHVNEWLEKKYDVLEDYLKNYNYIALGGAAKDKGGKSVLHPFLSAMFKRTQNKIRVHGFGITDIQYLKKYPFYSVDSTSWNQGGRYGNSLGYEKFNVKQNNKKMHLFYRKARDYKHRDDLNVDAYVKMYSQVDVLWKMRGIKWSDNKEVRQVSENT